MSERWWTDPVAIELVRKRNASERVNNECSSCRAMRQYLNDKFTDPMVIGNLASLALDMPVSIGLQYLGTLENIIRLSKQGARK